MLFLFMLLLIQILPTKHFHHILHSSASSPYSHTFHYSYTNLGALRMVSLQLVPVPILYALAKLP